MEIKLTFQPSGKSVYVLPGTLLLEAAGLAGLVLQTPCGGKGTCGKCRVIINGTERLACRTVIDVDTTVEIPLESMFESRHSILVDDDGHHGAGFNPRVKTEGALGAAFDLGSTTVVGTLFDLTDGRELAVKSLMNGQIPFGDDVISRIQHVCESTGSVKEMQSAAVKTINDIIDELCVAAGVEPEGIADVTIAGNAAMQQILCGMDVTGLGSIPFEQEFHEAQVVSAEELGINACGQVYIFPQIDGFVGGDTVAGVLAARIKDSSESVLFMDIGTNGEIVLCANGKTLAASTAAGPAFEGARIKNGMRAVHGAIEKVIITDIVQCNVIGNAKASGLCGTGLIDAVAGLLDSGVIDSYGRVLDDEDLPANLPDAVRERVITDGDHRAFVLVPGEQTASGYPICIWQKDVRELQLATGALRAGANILLKQAGITVNDIDEVLLAGGFGNFIRRNHACRIGLLPDVDSEKIRFIGNAASLGAKLALLSVDEREYAEQIRKEAEHVDLSKDADFQNEFANAMIFPEK